MHSFKCHQISRPSKTANLITMIWGVEEGSHPRSEGHDNFITTSLDLKYGWWCHTQDHAAAQNSTVGAILLTAAQTYTHSHTNVIYLQNVARSCSGQIDKWLTGDWQVIDSWSKLLLHANRIKIKDVWKKTAKHQISGGVKRLAKHQNLTMYHPLFFVIQRKYLVNQFPLQPPTKLFFKQKCHCYCSPVPSTDTRWQHLKNNNNIFA